MDEPYFSIVIPTRNRSDLLRRALRSALWQTLDDFEVVVFDNASDDNTPAIHREFNDSRIRYVRPQNWLIPQVAFEEAYKVSRGKYLHTIGDDDALLPHCLEKAKSIIDKYDANFVCFSTKCFYHYSDWIDDFRKNTLLFQEFTRRETILDSATELKSIYNFHFTTERHPNVMNSFFRKSDIDHLLAKHGQILLDEQMGDISIAIFFLNLTKRYVLLDEPLQVAGSSGRSNSANQAMVMERSPEAITEEFRMWFADKDKVNRYLDGVPIKMPLWSNFQIATMLRQRKILNLDLQIDWVAYFKKMWRALARLEARGIDVAAQQKHFFDALSAQNLRVRLEVNLYVKTRRRKRLKSPTSVRTNETLIMGDKAGFDDILGAAKYAYEHYFLGSSPHGTWKRENQRLDVDSAV
jgi:glycosyltransferase involved in cell wall biosynthesis